MSPHSCRDPPKKHYFWSIQTTPIDIFEESEHHSSLYGLGQYSPHELAFEGWVRPEVHSLMVSDSSFAKPICTIVLFLSTVMLWEFSQLGHGATLSFFSLPIQLIESQNFDLSPLFSHLSLLSSFPGPFFSQLILIFVSLYHVYSSMCLKKRILNPRVDSRFQLHVQEGVRELVSHRVCKIFQKVL